MSSAVMLKKLVPGVTDYKKIVEDGICIDKTSYFAGIDRIKFSLLFRPSGFGKSLLLSTMRYYFDYKFEDQFEELFKGTYVYDNPSPNKNSYSVMTIDFSGAKAKTEKQAEIEMNAIITKSIQTFLDENGIEDSGIDFSHQLTFIFDRLYERSERPIFLLIDGYDRFFIDTDESGCAIAPHFLENFLADVQHEVQRGTIKRIVCAGAKPVAPTKPLIESNIATSVDLYGDKLHDIAGMTPEDVQWLLGSIPNFNESEIELLYRTLKELYNGYSFRKSTSKTLFETSSVLWYLHNYICARNRGFVTSDEMKARQTRFEREMRYIFKI
jgi:hypothetical protein